MTTKELLELAARALGAKDFMLSDDELGRIVSSANRWEAFNPHWYDGDAFRLQVELGIDLMFFDSHLEAAVPDKGYCVAELYGTDKRAATRKAILRIAAEIGRHLEDRSNDHTA